MPLTQDRNTPMKDGELIPVAVSGGRKIFAGAIVVAMASGFAAEGHTATGLTFLGRAENMVDNADGADGDKSVNVRRGKAFKFKNLGADAVTQARFGKPCYIVDDETVAATNGGNTRSEAGVVIGIEPDGVWVAS